jgi:hypothetical protein
LPLAVLWCVLFLSVSKITRKKVLYVLRETTVTTSMGGRKLYRISVDFKNYVLYCTDGKSTTSCKLRTVPVRLVHEKNTQVQYLTYSVYSLERSAVKVFTVYSSSRPTSKRKKHPILYSSSRKNNFTVQYHRLHGEYILYCIFMLYAKHVVVLVYCTTTVCKVPFGTLPTQVYTYVRVVPSTTLPGIYFAQTCSHTRVL